MKFSLLDSMNPEEIDKALRESGKRMFGESFQPVSTSMEDFFSEKPAVHQEPSQTLYATLKDRFWKFFKSDESNLETTVNEPQTAIDNAGHGLFRRLFTAAALVPLAYLAADTVINYTTTREPTAIVHAENQEARKLMMKAGFLAYKGDYAPAEELYHQSLDIEPTMNTYAGLGSLLVAMGKPEEGLEMANKALEMNPDHSYPYDILAKAYMELGAIQKAKEAAKIWYDKVTQSGTIINKRSLERYHILMEQ
jgi:tetratricopeptide (TPR) repeat protein